MMPACAHVDLNIWRAISVFHPALLALPCIRQPAWTRMQSFIRMVPAAMMRRPELLLSSAALNPANAVFQHITWQASQQCRPVWSGQWLQAA